MKINTHFFIISCSILHKMKNASDKSCTENQNTQNVPIFFVSNRTVYEMLKDIVQPGGPHMNT